MSKNRKLIFFIFASVLFLCSCSNRDESSEMFDPKVYLKETDSSSLSLSKLFDYVVSVNNISSPKPNRIEIELTPIGKISHLSMEIVDSETGKCYVADYSSDSDIFKIAQNEVFPGKAEELFDVFLLESAELVVKSLSPEESHSVYFLNLVSSGTVNIDTLEDAEFFISKDGSFQSIDALDDVPATEDSLFFAVYSGDMNNDIPSYFIVYPE